MLLNEFFGKAIEHGHGQESDKDRHGKTADDAFWYIVDHDRLYKDHFYPLAKKIKSAHAEGKDDKEALVKEFLPMINKGCKEFYYKHKMTGSLGKIFPEEMRKDMCERLYDHYCEDILKDRYKLGR